MAEGLSKLYQEVLEGRYDCVDRILLNGSMAILGYVIVQVVFGCGGDN